MKERNIVALILLLLAASVLPAQQAAPSVTRFVSILQFDNALNGGSTYVRLVADKNGSLYGTTPSGGANFVGNVFQLAPKTGGGWTYTRIYDFAGGLDGAYPQSSLTVDAAGNIYGTTYNGGTANLGTVFMLTPPGSPGGAWTETILHSFFGGSDGRNPYGGVIFDAAGNLYGTTQQGGPYLCTERKLSCGTIYQLTPSGSGGPWTATILYNFQGRADGAFPDTGLALDATGNLYGTTSYGGGTNPALGGMVFQLAPQVGGTWTYTTIYDFGLTGQPSFEGDLVLDGRGMLYGTSWDGGAANQGFVFALKPPAQQGGAWTLRNLWSFSGSDGSLPQGGVILGPKGVLYGTTYSGGNLNSCNFIGCGVVFQLGPPASGGPWTYTNLYTFTGGQDGAAPQGALLRNKNGVFFGTTSAGGKLGAGTVFQMK